MQIAVYLDRQTDRQNKVCLFVVDKIKKASPCFPDRGDAFCLFYKEDTS